MLQSKRFFGFESSLQATYRTALESREVAGQKIEAGERVLTIVAAANRDERHFDNPESFDISPRSQKTAYLRRRNPLLRWCCTRSFGGQNIFRRVVLTLSQLLCRY